MRVFLSLIILSVYWWISTTVSGECIDLSACHQLSQKPFNHNISLAPQRVGQWALKTRTINKSPCFGKWTLNDTVVFLFSFLQSLLLNVPSSIYSEDFTQRLNNWKNRNHLKLRAEQPFSCPCHIMSSCLVALLSYYVKSAITL